MNKMAYNNSENLNDNYTCKIEKDVLEFEYELNKNKNREILVDINSPFALGYIWKTLILLSKNPTTDKLLKMLGIKNKESVINDMKKNSDVFEDSGKLEIILPNIQNINTNYISKIEDIYKIKISLDDDNYDNKVKINLEYNFELEIPIYYQPKIIFDYLVGYNKNKTKFLELNDVPVSLIVDKTNNIVNLEIPCGSNMILGFLYDINTNLLEKIPFEFILKNKKSDHLIKRLVIPKINRNKKSNYSKNFRDALTQVHLGELVYGTLYDIDVSLNMGLNLLITKDISPDKYEIIKTFDEIIINHKCFYYIKNLNIPNKILSNGMISY